VPKEEFLIKMDKSEYDKIFIDVSGERRTRLLLLELAGFVWTKSKKRRFYYKYLCDCGTIGIVRKDDKAAKSCGCLTKELNRTRRTGMRALNSIETAERARLSAAKSVFKRYEKDSDMSFEEFLALTQLNCYYCDSPPIGWFHLGQKQNGIAKAEQKRLSKEGNTYFTKVWASEFGEEAVFKYNGFDRINQKGNHYKDNIVTCCKICNLMKNKLHLEEFLFHIKRIIKNVESK